MFREKHKACVKPISQTDLCRHEHKTAAEEIRPEPKLTFAHF